MESLLLSRNVLMTFVMAIAIAPGTAAWAAGPKTETVITTKKLCPVCAKKIVDKLRQTKGVAEARADVESKKIVVLPGADQELSPRALWETVERGGEQPTRLVGPSGTFADKPKQ